MSQLTIRDSTRAPLPLFRHLFPVCSARSEAARHLDMDRETKSVAVADMRRMRAQCSTAHTVRICITSQRENANPQCMAATTRRVVRYRLEDA